MEQEYLKDKNEVFIDQNDLNIDAGATLMEFTEYKQKDTENITWTINFEWKRKNCQIRK